MESKQKSNSVITSKLDLTAGTIVFTVLGAGDPFTFNVAAASNPKAYVNLNDNGKRAIVHGWLQRISDRAAIGRDKVTGQSASPAEKKAAMKSYAEHIANGGTWELAGGGLPAINRPALYQAVSAVRGVEVGKVEALYRDKTDEVLRTLLTISAIAGKYTELVRAEQPVNEKAEELLKTLEA